MLMNTIKPYYIVKTTLTYTFFMTYIAESPPTPRSPNFYLLGPGTHFYQNQLKFAFLNFFTDCQFQCL